MNPLSLAKPSSYYGHVRQDVLGVIQRAKITATNAVELGCGDGSTGAAIKKLLGITKYVGIEVEFDASQKARTVLDNVYCDDISGRMAITFREARKLDLLVALDVLEHLYDPWTPLSLWAKQMDVGGHLVTSIPNIQHISIIASLANGHFQYTAEGLLDATHVRFFTFESIESMLKDCGLEIVRVESVFTEKLDVDKLEAVGNNLKVGNMTLEGLTKEQVVGLATFQWIVVAKKVASVDPAGPVG